MTVKPFAYDLLKKYVILFGNIFNDVYINRENADGSNLDTIKVPLTYSARDKMLARVFADPALTKGTAITLPRMSFEYTSFQYDGSRKLPTMNVNYAKDGEDVVGQFTPVPYNINFNLYIYVKNSMDGTRIVEQILPIFTPDWSATVKLIPELDIERTIPLILNTVTPSDNYAQGNFIDRRAIIWTLAFTMKVYFFGPTTKSSIIKFVEVSVNATKDLTDPLNTSEKDVTITVQPGLTANGEPTTVLSDSIDYKEINASDNYGFIESWIKDDDGS